VKVVSSFDFDQGNPFVQDKIIVLQKELAHEKADIIPLICGHA